MNYEEKYKKALQAVNELKQITTSDDDIQKWADKHFPELAESEDEKIRKEILEYFQQFENEELRGVNISDWIAWLEKQGEKPADKIEPKFKVGDIIKHKKYGFTCKIIAIDTEYRLSECNGTHMPFDFQDFYELVEQNPAWSEDDEIEFNHILKTLTSVTKEQEIKGYNNLTSSINWLKSLKERIQPQPKQEWSEEDENALCDALWAMKIAAKIAKDENDMGNIWYTEKWLNSLKDRMKGE